jgi:hypothetical protein
VWSDAHEAILITCSPCHVTGVRAGMGPLLDPDEAWDMLVDVPSTQSGVPRINPGDPGNSYLLAKVEARHLALGGSGSSMPLVDRPQLPDAERVLLRRWIEAGAPRD